MSKDGHPLPQSEESRRDEVPEALEAAKGEGDDGRAPARTSPLVGPDGTPYPAGDPGRDPASVGSAGACADRARRDPGEGFFGDRGAQA